jgi:RNA polymerase sigma-70 factor, ECF subfamily
MGSSTLAWTLPRTSQSDRTWTVVSQNTVPEKIDLEALGDADLASASVAGTAGAFDLIVERHRRPVYQLCYRFVGNHEDASDLSQDVFLRAYRGLKNFKGQSALGTWLYRIAVNVCLNRVNAKSPKTESIEHHDQVDATSEPASDRLLREERAGRVRRAVAELPEKQRMTLILRMYHDMSHQEIAQAVGSSVGAVKANVFHALRNLKKLLGEEVL